MGISGVAANVDSEACEQAARAGSALPPVVHTAGRGQGWRRKCKMASLPLGTSASCLREAVASSWIASATSSAPPTTMATSAVANGGDRIRPRGGPLALVGVRAGRRRWRLAGERTEEEEEAAAGTCAEEEEEIARRRGGEELGAGSTPHARTHNGCRADRPATPRDPSRRAGRGSHQSHRAGLPAGQLAPHLPWPPPIEPCRSADRMCRKGILCQFFLMSQSKGGWWARRV
jgi:hypothetical protein